MVTCASVTPDAKSEKPAEAPGPLVVENPVAPIAIVMKPVDELRPDPKNPRNNQSAIEIVAASIRDFGFKVPIVVDGENNIVAGHSRYLAARMLRLSEVPTIVADDLSPEQLRGFSVAENRSSDFAFFDLEKLAEMDLPEQYIAEFDLSSLLDDSEYEAPELAAPQEEPTKREGLDLAPFEKYQYVTIICRSTYDYTNLLLRLGLEDLQAGYFGPYLKRGHSTGRIIEYPAFLERIDHPDGA